VPSGAGTGSATVEIALFFWCSAKDIRTPHKLTDQKTPSFPQSCAERSWHLDGRGFRSLTASARDSGASGFYRYPSPGGARTDVTYEMTGAPSTIVR